MKLLNLFKKKKPTSNTYEYRLKRLEMIGCTQEFIQEIKKSNLTCQSIDCAIIFISTNMRLKNDYVAVCKLIDAAYNNALKDKKKNSVQWHALQIVEAFKKL